MSFYRIYRPQNIGELDNNTVRRELEKLSTVDVARLPHAYLFHGAKGTGKTTSARLIAKIFNCTDRKNDRTPCGSCDQCKSITNGTNMDVVEIDAASNRGIDEIRLLRERIGLTPIGASHTVYIIDEVHMLTHEAFNALLKTLEEPPAHAVFVLATTELSKVPETIRSRCLTITFGKASTDELKRSLSRVVNNEKIRIEESALDLLAQLSDGSYRDAIKMLEQLSLAEDEVTVDSIRRTFGVIPPDKINGLIEAVGRRDITNILEILHAFTRGNTDMKYVASDLLSELNRQLDLNIEGKTNVILGVPDIKDLVLAVNEAFILMKYSPVPELPLKLALLSFCQSGRIANADFHDPQLSVTKPTPKPEVITDPPKTSPKSPEVSSDIPRTRPDAAVSELITLQKLVECWRDIIEEVKPANHSIAGVLRSCKPKSVADGTVTLEAFYKFHQEKLSEIKTRDILAKTFKKLFGAEVKVQVVLGKK